MTSAEIHYREREKLMQPTHQPPPLPPTKGKQDFDGKIDGAGYKGSMDDPAKPPLTLIPQPFLWAVARVLGKGATKYARGNWARGMSFSAVADGVLRHVTAWAGGETHDPETGENHLAHAACGLAFLLTFQEGPRAAEYSQYDDRISIHPTQE